MCHCVDMFIRTNNPEPLTIWICFCQSLGVCVCSDSWVGSDCSVPRDSNSLMWETLLDTQLTVVSTGYDQESKIMFRSGSMLTFTTQVK